jgi:hypothetical protein
MNSRNANRIARSAAPNQKRFRPAAKTLFFSQPSTVGFQLV